MLFMGSLTACGGGWLRDALILSRPPSCAARNACYLSTSLLAGVCCLLVRAVQFSGSEYVPVLLAIFWRVFHRPELFLKAAFCEKSLLPAS